MGNVKYIGFGIGKPKLSVVIAVLEDQAELTETLKTLRATSPRKEVEIIVVDDASGKPVEVPVDVLLRRNKTRVGCGASRHIGVGLAVADHVLIADSHMRFQAGWYETAMKRIIDRPMTVHCAVCLGLNEANMEVTKPNHVLSGARLVFDSVKQKFGGEWKTGLGVDDEELSCMLGACYFVPRDFFLKIGGSWSSWWWGGFEPTMSLKVWLAGGEIRLLQGVKVGHKFKKHFGYPMNNACGVYNKLRGLAVTLTPEQFVVMNAVFRKEPGYAKAKAKLDADSISILSERNEFQKVAVRDLAWLVEKFQIKFPEKNL